MFEVLSQYQELIVIIVVAAASSFILTPLTGAIAQRIGAVDMPASLRDRNDPTRLRKIHDKVMPQLGGLAVTLGIIFGLILAHQSGILGDINNWQFTQILLGVSVIVVLGIWDDIVDLPAHRQILIQIVAAAVITTAGIRIDYIDVLGMTINFNLIEFTFNLGERTLFLSPIADLITIFWIVGVVNAINWVDGIDGLSGVMSMVAAFTMMFIATKNEAMLAALLAASLGGAVLGYLPFNFPPAKTYSGSIGVMTQGYLLAILAIVSGAKLSTSFILLALPLLDALWVLIGRYRRHRRQIRSLRDLLAISDKTHLHHRLMDLGLSRTQTLWAESAVFLVFCIAAYYFAGFSTQTLYLLGVVLLCIVIFSVINFLARRNTARRKVTPDKEEQRTSVVEDSPEDRYAY